jgi:GNAT superfamily N-acetyltransferase
MARDPILDDIFWQSLSNTQAQFAEGAGAARRYARGFSPIVAFADARRPAFDDLAPFCASGEKFYCDSWSGAAPDGWSIEVESTMYRMRWAGVTPTNDPAPDATRLSAEHVPQAMALAELTHPGPFGPRTIELGDYFGCFEDGRLIAMAGERMAGPGLREVSGVATHPDFQGRGLARRLMTKLIGRQLARNEIPFLHVMCANESAHRLYLAMGFEDYVETVVRVVARTG